MIQIAKPISVTSLIDWVVNATTIPAKIISNLIVQIKNAKPALQTVNPENVQNLTSVTQESVKIDLLMMEINVLVNIVLFFFI